MSGRPRVVVADDHPRILDAATAILSRTCDVVAAVPDGMTAIDAAARLQPDIVVLDIAMPGLDGFQTATRLRASGSSARIVFLSNHAGDDFVLAGMSRGASAFVPKARMELDLTAAVDHAHAGRSFLPSASVLPGWRRPAGQRHDLQLYATDGFLISAVIGFLEAALEAGDAVATIASASHCQALDAEMRARRLDPDALIAAGRYTVLDSQAALESIMRDGMPQADLYAAAVEPLLQQGLQVATSSPPHVSIWGEIAPLLLATGQFEAMHRLEQIADAYLATRPMSILCAYSLEALERSDPDVFAHLCAEHTTIVPSA